MADVSVRRAWVRFEFGRPAAASAVPRVCLPRRQRPHHNHRSTHRRTAHHFAESATSVITTWEHHDEYPLAQLERRASAESLTQDEVDTRFFAIITDLVGTPTELVDEHGSIAWQSRTTLWGTTTWNRSASVYTPLRFPGQYADHETGLHYNLFRHHNPHTWSDPLGLVPKACLDMDAYLWDGSVRFGKLDDLGRPTGAWAALRKDNMKGGTGAAPSIWPPGWRGDGRLFNEARGHLLARKLGGPGTGENGYRNLVTLTQNPVNTPIMRGIEKEVHRAVSKGENVQYSVVPVYEGTNPVPIRLNISAHGDRGFSLNRPLENPAADVRIPVPR